MATTAFRLTASTGLHRGDRAYQQDQVEILMHERVAGCALAVLADGMGGKSGGRKAADQVILTARQLFDRYVPSWREDNFSLRHALSIPSQQIWDAHQEAKRQLIEFVNG